MDGQVIENALKPSSSSAAVSFNDMCSGTARGDLVSATTFGDGKSWAVLNAGEAKAEDDVGFARTIVHPHHIAYIPAAKKFVFVVKCCCYMCARVQQCSTIDARQMAKVQVLPLVMLRS